MCMNFFTSYNPIALIRITQKAKGNPSLDAYITATQLQLITSLGATANSLIKVIKAISESSLKDFSKNFLQLVDYADTS